MESMRGNVEELEICIGSWPLSIKAQPRPLSTPCGIGEVKLGLREQLLPLPEKETKEVGGQVAHIFNPGNMNVPGSWVAK